MPHITLSLSSSGPVVQVAIGVSLPRRDALVKASKVVPEEVMANLLVDTGASHSCLDKTILAPLGLSATGVIQVHTPSTGKKAQQFRQYDVAVLLYHEDNSRLLATVPVTEVDLSAQGIDGLLGRDILSQCLMVYDGRAGTFCLAF